LVGGQLELQGGVTVNGGARAATFAGAPAAAPAAAPEAAPESRVQVDLGPAVRSAALGVLPPCPSWLSPGGRLGYY
ncbi:MAG: dihydrolipoamide succinyltransferase, partial [Gemmatimonadales bacterium]